MFLALALLVAACSSDSGYTQLESGFEYKFVENADGKKPEVGDVMMVDLRSVYGEDSVLIERTAEGDGFVLDPLRGLPPKLKEIIDLCDEGDSIHVRMSLMEYGLLTRMPIARNMDTTKTVVMQLRIAEVENESTIMERRKKVQIEKDNKIIEAYLAEKGLEAEVSDDGVYQVVREAGNGPKPVNGQRVAVNYTVRLTDGSLIDTSNEEVARAEGTFDQRRVPYRPYEFLVGNDNVVQGWHLGIPLVNEGGKSTLLLPSWMAYGPQGRPGIAPNTVLVFDVEVVEIK